MFIGSVIGLSGFLEGTFLRSDLFSEFVQDILGFIDIVPDAFRYPHS